MKKICKYDPVHWLMQDDDKNLILMNELTGSTYDLQNLRSDLRKENCIPQYGAESSLNYDEYTRRCLEKACDSSE